MHKLHNCRVVDRERWKMCVGLGTTCIGPEKTCIGQVKTCIWREFPGRTNLSRGTFLQQNGALPVWQAPNHSKSLEGAADAIPLGWAHPSTHKGISILLTKLHVLICHRMTGFGSGKMLPNTARRATIRKCAFQMTFVFFPERRVVHRNFWMHNYFW